MAQSKVAHVELRPRASRAFDAAVARGVGPLLRPVELVRLERVSRLCREKATESAEAAVRSVSSVTLDSPACAHWRTWIRLWYILRYPPGIDLWVLGKVPELTATPSQELQSQLTDWRESFTRTNWRRRDHVEYMLKTARRYGDAAFLEAVLLRVRQVSDYEMPTIFACLSRRYSRELEHDDDRDTPSFQQPFEVLLHFFEHPHPKLPALNTVDAKASAAGYAAHDGDLRALKALHALGAPLDLDPELGGSASARVEAKFGGKTKIIDWMASLEPPAKGPAP